MKLTASNFDIFQRSSNYVQALFCGVGDVSLIAFQKRRELGELGSTSLRTNPVKMNYVQKESSTVETANETRIQTFSRLFMKRKYF